METQMMQEYNKGPRELTSVPNYKLFTYQEAMDVQAKNHWGVLAFVLAVAGGVSGYLLRGLYLGIFDYNAFAVQHDWIADVNSVGQFTLLMVAVGVVLGVLIAYIFRNKYANSNFGWAWFSSALVLPLGTYAVAPVVLWVLGVLVTLLGIAVGLAVIWFIWNIFFG
jgi:hypothetical protein